MGYYDSQSIKLNDYPEYGKSFLIKKDLKKKNLLKYGITAKQSLIDALCDIAKNKSPIVLINYDYYGNCHVRHVWTYSIEILMRCLSAYSDYC